MFCPKCGKQNDDMARFCQGCGASLQVQPPPPPSAQAVPAPAGDVMYAGFWERFVAIVIDFIILSIATGIIAAATFGTGAPLGILVSWLYEAFMLSSEWQATVGKRAMSIAVTDIDGKRITFARATGRHFAKWISILLCFVGFIIAAFTEKKQALHDMIAETLVVKR
jgi:uncharacterized RDD family membrane protein YckC